MLGVSLFLCVLDVRLFCVESNMSVSVTLFCILSLKVFYIVLSVAVSMYSFEKSLVLGTVPVLFIEKRLFPPLLVGAPGVPTIPYSFNFIFELIRLVSPMCASYLAFVLL